MTEEKRKRMKERIPEDVREHYKNARKELRESFRSLLPPEFVEHRRVARKEMLLAAKSLLNHAIERIEKREA
jgi:hypothetical protein